LDRLETPNTDLFCDRVSDSGNVFGDEMKLPQTIFVSRHPVTGFLRVRERLTDFEGLRDAQIGEYRLVENGGTKLTINEKPEKK
jgi:hypothetical protein